MRGFPMRGFRQDLRRMVRRRIVDDDDFGRHRLLRQRRQRQPQPVCLVARADDDADLHQCGSAVEKQPRSSSTRTTSSATSRLPSAVRWVASTFKRSAPARATMLSTSITEIPVRCDSSASATLNLRIRVERISSRPWWQWIDSPGTTAETLYTRIGTADLSRILAMIFSKLLIETSTSSGSRKSNSSRNHCRSAAVQFLALAGYRR